MALTYASAPDGVDRATVVTGEDITAGQLVAIDPDTGYAMIANAKTGANQQAPAFGIAEVDVDSGYALEVKREGLVEGASGLTPGHPVYLGETDGAVTATEPTDSGDVSQVVGQAVSATAFMLAINPDYATVGS